MKLHADSPQAALNTVTAYGPGYIEINRQRHHGAILLLPEGPIQSWSVTDAAALDDTAFRPLEDLAAEVVLIGTGDRQRLLHPRLLRNLQAKGIGVDAMDTRAACRTYNILMTEGRKVLAALLPLSA